MDKDRMPGAERKQRIQLWGSKEEAKECLMLLHQRYPVLPAGQLAPTWERQHLLAGQQQVLADLTALLAKGEM